jgi:hypothetical protein
MAVHLFFVGGRSLSKFLVNFPNLVRKSLPQFVVGSHVKFLMAGIAKAYKVGGIVVGVAEATAASVNVVNVRRLIVSALDALKPIPPQRGYEVVVAHLVHLRRSVSARFRAVLLSVPSAFCCLVAHSARKLRLTWLAGHGAVVSRVKEVPASVARFVVFLGARVPESGVARFTPNLQLVVCGNIRSAVHALSYSIWRLFHAVIISQYEVGKR